VSLNYKVVRFPPILERLREERCPQHDVNLPKPLLPHGGDTIGILLPRRLVRDLQLYPLVALAMVPVYNLPDAAAGLVRGRGRRGIGAHTLRAPGTRRLSFTHRIGPDLRLRLPTFFPTPAPP